MTGRRETAVALMAKAPRAGEVKTRLCPPYSFQEAAELYRCFLLDKLEQVRELKEVVAVISYAPEDARPLFESLGGGNFALIPQRGRDLGERLDATFRRVFAGGFRSAVVMDSDTPTLPPEYLERALSLLSDPEVDVVLGPSEDGGYYLIGLRELHPELFENIPWSTEKVLPETVRRAEEKSLRISHLPAWFDVDTPQDLERLIASLPASDGQRARHTRRFLREKSG